MSDYMHGYKAGVKDGLLAAAAALLIAAIGIVFTYMVIA